MSFTSVKKGNTYTICIELKNLILFYHDFCLLNIKI